MEDKALAEKYEKTGRTFEPAKPFDEELGWLKLLPGTWSNKALPGRGWNIIALPFAAAKFNYRVLMNQYDEELTFQFVDKGVPNRGIRFDGTTPQTDQRVVTLDYQQKIKQIAVRDSEDSADKGAPGDAIHHEPGLFLHMLNFQTEGLDVARCATIPHGDSALALGKGSRAEGGPKIPRNVSALPVGVPDTLDQCDVDPDRDYLAPYRHFVEHPFKGVLAGEANFPGFLVRDATALLQAASIGVDITHTTELNLDTTVETAGIRNLPFVVKQADAASMKSIFWIQELAEADQFGNPKLRMQYFQVVMLDFFFPRRDGLPGRIRWPHISINTMDKVVQPRPAKENLARPSA